MIVKNIINIGPTVIGTLLNIITLPYIINNVKIELYGQYIFVNLIIFLSGKINYGLDKGLLSERVNLSSILIKKIKFIYLITSFVISSVLAIYEFKNHYIVYSIILFTLIYQNYLYNFKKTYLIFSEKYVKVGVLNTIYWNIILLSPAFFLYFKKFNLIDIFIFIIMIRALIIYFMNIEHISTNHLKINNLNLVKKYNHYMFSDIINSCLDNIDKIYIKVFLGYSAYASYSVIHQIISKIAVITQSISSLEFGEYIKNNNKYENNFSKFCIFYLFLYFLIIITINPIFSIWFNHSQFVADNSIYIDYILLSIWLSGFNHISTAYNDAIGKTKKFLSLEFTFLIISILILIIIIKIFGILGVITFTILREIFFFSIKNKKLSIYKNYLLTISLSIIFLIIKKLYE